MTTKKEPKKQDSESQSGLIDKVSHNQDGSLLSYTLEDIERDYGEDYLEDLKKSGRSRSGAEAEYIISLLSGWTPNQRKIMECYYIHGMLMGDAIKAPRIPMDQGSREFNAALKIVCDRMMSDGIEKL